MRVRKCCQTSFVHTLQTNSFGVLNLKYSTNFEHTATVSIIITIPFLQQCLLTHKSN